MCLAKQKTKHGGFGDWKRKWGFSDATVSRYIRLHRVYRSPESLVGRGLLEALREAGVLKRKVYSGKMIEKLPEKADESATDSTERLRILAGTVDDEEVEEPDASGDRDDRLDEAVITPTKHQRIVEPRVPDGQTSHAKRPALDDPPVWQAKDEEWDGDGDEDDEDIETFMPVSTSTTLREELASFPELFDGVAHRIEWAMQQKDVQAVLPQIKPNDIIKESERLRKSLAALEELILS